MWLQVRASQQLLWWRQRKLGRDEVIRTLIDERAPTTQTNVEPEWLCCGAIHFTSSLAQPQDFTPSFLPSKARAPRRRARDSGLALIDHLHARVIVWLAALCRFPVASSALRASASHDKELTTHFGRGTDQGDNGLRRNTILFDNPCLASLLFCFWNVWNVPSRSKSSVVTSSEGSLDLT